MTARLFWNVCSLEARTLLSYRVDFWVNAVAGFLADFGVIYFLWAAVFHESGRVAIGGRDFDTTLVYYLAVIVLGKLVRGTRFQGAVSQDIYEGHLNRYLVFPLSYVRFKYAQRIGRMAPALVQLVLFGGVTLLLLEVPPEVRVTVPQVGMALLAVALGGLIYFLFEYILHLVAFWADNVWSLDVAHWFVASLLGGWMLPLSVFPDRARVAIEMLPFRFYFDFPARVLLGEIGAAEWARGLLLGAGWCLFLAMVARWIWRRGQLRYTGVGI